MKNTLLKPILAASCVGLMTILSACSEPDYEPQPESMAVEVTQEDVVAAEDAAEPVVAEVTEPASDAPPVDALPPETRSSEESVQPDSDTLFY